MTFDRTNPSYGGLDPDRIPSYTVGEAAHYLQLPKSTVSYWLIGGHYPSRSGKKRFQPIIRIADRKARLLSFQNLIEVHVLGAIRRVHEIPLRDVRYAVTYLEKKLGSKHPLYEEQMLTDGTDLFVERLGDYVNVTQDGQLAMRSLLQAHLKRIERKPGGGLRLFPFTMAHFEDPEDYRPIAIDPTVSFGRPVLTGTGIATSSIVERFKAGESPEALAADFGFTKLAPIFEAIRYEYPANP